MPDLQSYTLAVMEWDYFIHTYLFVGVILAVAILKWPGNGSESPGATFVMITLLWGPVLLVGAPLVVISLVLAGICSLLGIEASEGDSHGT